ncbi:MAG: GntR family transcriptional regulator [Acidimicrobiales bacterium]
MAKSSTWATKVTRSNGLLHTQIADTVAAAIADGRLRPGDRLEPERDLAAEFGVNRLTVRQALADLQRRRLIRRRTGRNGGTFVADPIIDYDLTTFAGFSAQVRRHGQVAGATVLRAVREMADAATAEALQLSDRDDVIVIDRLRFANEAPVLVEHSCFPAERFGALLDESLDGSLYDLLAERFGARPRRAVESIEPVRADARVARLLEVPRGRPLLAVNRVAFDADGVPVESARDILRGDRTRTVVWSFDLPTS